MNLLLDTLLALWGFNDSPEPPVTAREAVVQPDVESHVSRATFWEIAIKVSIGKPRGDMKRIARAILGHGLQWHDIGITHLLKLADLPRHDDHKDPFDRLLAAHSLCEPVILLTSDARLARSGPTVRVTELWN